MSAAAKRFIVASSVLFLAMPTTSRASNILLRAMLGPSFITGDVGDRIAGPGVDLGGGVYAGVDDQLYLGLGGHVSIHTGRSEMIGFVSEDKTKGALGLTFEAGMLFYVLKEENTPLRIHVGAHAGFGALGWEYADRIAETTGEDSDAVGFFLFAPEAGVEVILGTSAGLFATARYMVNSYSDETSEGFLWDVAGGDMVLLQGGLSVYF